MIIKENRKYKNIFIRLSVFLIALYAFTISFGTVFRIESDLSPKPWINLSYLTYAIWLFCFLSAIVSNRLKSNTVINYLLCLVLFLFGNTLLFSDDLLKNLITLTTLFANILLVYFVANIKFQRSFLYLLFNIITLGALLSSSLTLVDKFIIDIPYFNEMTFRLTGFESRGVSGPFQSRTTMGAFYSISMSISLISFFVLKRPLYLISFIVSFLAMISTFNRGAPFAIVVMAIIFLIRKSKLNVKTLLKTLLVVLILAMVLYNIFPEEQRNALKYLVLSSLNIIEKEEQLSDSDNVRTYALKQIITEEIFENPFGQGFNDFYLNGTLEPISVHSNINYIFYIAGVFGIFWLSFFLIKLYKSSQQAHNIEQVIIKYSLFTWALYSMTHMTINTFLAWLLLGLMLNRFIYTEVYNYPPS